MNKHIFSKEEEKYILDNWGKISIHAMKNNIGCTWNAVYVFAKDNNLNLPKSNAWSDDDVEKLIEYAEKYDFKKIAKKLDRTENAVYLKAKRLGISLIQTRKVWTLEEEKYLKDNWGTVTIETLSSKMHRSIFSLKVRAVRLGLGSMICSNQEDLSINDVVNTLGVTRDVVVKNWGKKGLNIKHKEITKNKSYMIVNLEDLIIFLKNNQNLWDSRNVGPYELGEESDWLLEKRSKDRALNPRYYHRFTEYEKKQIITLFKFGKSYEEIAVLLNRSEGSIAMFLRNNGYSYMMPRFWKGSEIKYLRENYGVLDNDEISKYLNRSVKAVAAKASEEGFQRIRKK